MRAQLLLSVFALSTLSIACEEKKPPPPPVASEATKPAAELKVDRAVLSVFSTLPAKMDSATAPVTEDRIALGKQLYFDERLSKNHDLSCNSCHALDGYGVDNKPTSPGHKGQLGARNSPTVYNAALHTSQFWDGRAKDVEEQALGPILNPVEMAMKDEAAVLAVVRSMPEYVASFKKAFPDDKDAVTYANVGKAIGAFERTLVTPSRFDKYLAGDDAALSAEERAGLAKFLSAGCASCHAGAALGGTMYRKLGLVKPWATELKDQGRFDVTHEEADKHVFKVPSLRNIEKTGPYFHDGSVATLGEAVKLMASHQLGVDLPPSDVDSIVTFLKSLTGELPTIEKPELPKSTAKTPKADPS